MIVRTNFSLAKKSPYDSAHTTAGNTPRTSSHKKQFIKVVTHNSGNATPIRSLKEIKNMDFETR